MAIQKKSLDQRQKHTEADVDLATSEREPGRDKGSRDPRSRDPGGRKPRGREPCSRDPRSRDPRSCDPRGRNPRSRDARSCDPRGRDPSSRDPSSRNPRSRSEVAANGCRAVQIRSRHKDRMGMRSFAFCPTLPDPAIRQVTEEDPCESGNAAASHKDLGGACHAFL